MSEDRSGAEAPQRPGNIAETTTTTTPPEAPAGSLSGRYVYNGGVTERAGFVGADR